MVRLEIHNPALFRFLLRVAPAQLREIYNAVQRQSISRNSLFYSTTP